jgi:hypothetical protein
MTWRPLQLELHQPISDQELVPFWFGYRRTDAGGVLSVSG